MSMFIKIISYIVLGLVLSTMALPALLLMTFCVLIEDPERDKNKCRRVSEFTYDYANTYAGQLEKLIRRR